MPSQNEREPLKITLDDLAAVSLPEVESQPAPVSPTGVKSYGTISQAAEQFVAVTEERGSLFLQGWFYLGLAGLIGAVAGWALCEPGFVDGDGHRWGNIILLPVILMLMCVGLGISESVAERSVRKALLRGVLSLPLGLVLGFVFYTAANILYSVALRLCYEAGAQSYKNPAVWLARAIAWMVFGAAGGVVYGIVGQSAKKGKYGVIGGMLGAGIGGFVFDPIAIFTHGGAVSRAVGFALVGVATGVGMGLVESALKDRWLYVMAGPLAGKQFILYKAQTTIGSLQDCDIYLFKDPQILPRHAVIEINGTRVQMRASGMVQWAGQPIESRVLRDGDLLQIGRYSFRYKEKQRT
jgi:hypothetical protein